MSELVTGADQFAGSASRQPKEYRPLGSGELADAWELGEFLGALGPVMRLPPKEDDRPVPTPRLRAAASGRRAVRLVALAIGLMGAAAGAGPLWRALHPSLPMPQGLLGVWSTNDATHRDRTFELSAVQLRLGLGARDATYPITAIRRRDSADAAVYVLEYRDEETALEFALAIGPDSVVKLRNLPAVSWSRKVR